MLTGAAPSASNPANGGGASNAAALLNPYDTARLGLVTSIATYGPGMLDQSSTTGYVTEGWTSWLKYLSPALWIGGQASKDAQKAVNGAVTAGEDVVKGAEIIAGIFAWLTKPVNLLRIAEIIAGAMCLAVGIAMYARILAPGVGGLVASVAEGATPLGRAAAVGTKTARSVAKKIPDANDRRAVRAMKSPGPTRKSAEYKAAAKGRKFNALGEEYF